MKLLGIYRKAIWKTLLTLSGLSFSVQFTLPQQVSNEQLACATFVVHHRKNNEQEKESSGKGGKCFFRLKISLADGKKLAYQVVDKLREKKNSMTAQLTTAVGGEHLIFAAAIKGMAMGIILGHNHSSGICNRASLILTLQRRRWAFIGLFFINW